MDAVTWNMNEVAYDTQAKEFVKITNMVCRLCQQGDRAHQIKGVECATEPFEAVAIRLITFNQGKATLGFTYRAVDAKLLQKTTHKLAELDVMTENPIGQFYTFIGRV
jgi:hypothetical protein